MTAREVVHPVELDQIRQKAQRLVDQADPATPGLNVVLATLIRVIDSHEEVRGRCVALVHAADRPITILTNLAASAVRHDHVYGPARDRLQLAVKKAEEVLL